MSFSGPTAGPSAFEHSALDDAAIDATALPSPTWPVATSSFLPLPTSAPGLSALTQYATERESHAAATPTPSEPPRGADLEAQDGDGQGAGETAIEIRAESPSYSAACSGVSDGLDSAYLSSPLLAAPTTSPLQLTISLASSPAPSADALSQPSSASVSTSSSASHLFEPPAAAPLHISPLAHSREPSLSLSHHRPSISVRRLSVSQRAGAGTEERTQEDTEEMRWLTQANAFEAMDALRAIQPADERKDAENEAAEAEAEAEGYPAADSDAEEKEEEEMEVEEEEEEEKEAEAYEERRLPPAPTSHPAIHPINQTSLLPPSTYAIQRIDPSLTPLAQRPASHRVSEHISLSYDPRSHEPSQSHSSLPLPLTPSPTSQLSHAPSELPPSPALLSRPLIRDESREGKVSTAVSPLTLALPPGAGLSSGVRLTPAHRRLQRRIGFALAEHDEDEEEEAEAGVARKAELRPVKPTRRSAKQVEAERRDKERRRRQHQKEQLEAKERRFLARDIQERIGSFPRPLLQAVLSCLLTSPPVANLSNLSSSYALTSGQHVLLDLSGLAQHWSSAQSSLPDELAHGLSTLLGLKSGVLVCDERTSVRDLMYARKEEEREEKYGGAGGRSSGLSIASLVSSSSTSSPASPNGPLFCPLVVLHNLHLAPHTLHSTLISAGRLGSVTIDGSVIRLPRLSLLVATHSQHLGGGLWCGGSGFSARQLLELFMYDVMAEATFPSQLRAYLAQQPPLPPSLSSRAALDYGALLPSLQAVTCSHLMRQYVHDLIATLRQHVRVAFGPSPATAHSLLCAASTHALLSGVGYVTPHDVDVVAAASLAHRITLRMLGGGGVGRGTVGGGSGAGAAGGARAIVQHLVTKVLVPPK